MAAVLMHWLAGSLITLLHPFFISMTDINHNAKNQTLEVSVRIFTDDFEKALQKKCNCKVELIRPANKVEMEKLVSNYVSSHVNIKLDGNRVPLEFVGYNEEDGSIWTYYEGKNINAFKKIDLFNNILHDDNDQQVNMVHIKSNGKEKTEKLDYPNNFLTVNW